MELANDLYGQRHEERRCAASESIPPAIFWSLELLLLPVNSLYVLVIFSKYMLVLFVCVLGEMIGRLTITMNRTRQAVITKELIEIISGAAATKQSA